MSKRLGLWIATLTVIALHADLLLSLGYTKCAFEYASGIHKLAT